jgi:hypothetical protein
MCGIDDIATAIGTLIKGRKCSHLLLSLVSHHHGNARQVHLQSAATAGDASGERHNAKVAWNDTTIAHGSRDHLYRKFGNL